MSLIFLAINGGLSAVGAVICYQLILTYIPIFIARKMYGNDQCKVSNAPVPEPMGVICAAVYLIVMFMFIPFPFLEWKGQSEFPYEKLLALLSGLISISTAILLGFADDMLDLKWRHKLLFPTLSSLPLLMVYYVSGNSTTVIVPTIVRHLVQPIVLLPVTINISFIYYIFMGMVIVFCTNAINILAGINGLESGQSLVISASVCLFNFVQIFRFSAENSTGFWHHTISLYFLLPFTACTAILFYFNKYPSRVFVGDTFCYWSGMTLAVVSILGHFSKTLMLFFVPQIINFLYSIPQLFHLVPCPRHRLPKYDPKTDTVSMSIAEFKKTDLKRLGALFIAVCKSIGMLHVKEVEKDGEIYLQINNLTIINLVLKFAGPLHEKTLNDVLMSIQILCSLLAFFIRFYLASLFYDVVE
ncbi:UDP-N-acetylglucosamine--dolichyl-phosphate N-acetylglucosaminephosphotransferase [Caenorhabditis elegans]|uniref:UDP-N-acetylglucosamine--dolichyl-phosphate N-acetylglucosaminephosphotransferase n=1 Tax=Caenorhabditis elegans TaxID=6239 RepID=Q9U1Z2_CAEEL|nr:UDP-N-acetylglucosamine--dolichyl-phosphate N-acetylglucosaminephosphotransferase [Caenorhabditis elegans]CAB60399.2 UDP-N-acetylglucosamine--dolichyl-phosphate N-acetylglucosaminephosphotransferase [Caenorhabditis elegans]|eukprot:NP_507859.2 Asparagine Linked Glycosylation (ALG) homolog, Nematode [Caenorhabditis elegans]